jgi:hypothetical protein
MGSPAPHQPDDQGNECTLGSMAIGAAGSRLESYVAHGGKSPIVVENGRPTLVTLDDILRDAQLAAHALGQRAGRA